MTPIMLEINRNSLKPLIRKIRNIGMCCPATGIYCKDKSECKKYGYKTCYIK